MQNMNASQNYTEWNTPDIKEHVLYDSIDLKS